MYTTATVPPRQSGNIAAKISAVAGRYPHQRAVVFPAGRDAQGRVTYAHLTFAQLEQETDRLARGLIEMGVQPGHRMVLFVPPSLEFIALTFALFKAGAVAVLIDPGMGIKNVFRCLNQVDPDGIVAIPLAHAARMLFSSTVPHARFNVTVGNHRWFWGGLTYGDLLGGEWTPLDAPHIKLTDPAAIIFTSGSTGPAKGVLYEHGMFAAQVDDIRDYYDIQPGEIDLPGFPLFALFNSAMAVTTVIPDMDPSRPAQVDPKKIIEAIENHGVTQAFGSPAIWNAVSRYCVEQGVQFPTLKRVLSAGAPVPIRVIERMHQVFKSKDAQIYTPYGATESLPVASISGRQVLAETAEQTRRGGGTCVGELFPGITVRIVEMAYDPIESYAEVRELPAGEIGEIIVQGAVVTREYYRRPDATAAAKIPDGEDFWHRMGDMGYFDEQGRLWFCGRKAHVVETPAGRMFSVCCEAIFNEDPRVFRSALVGIGERPQQTPVIVIEPEAGAFPEHEADRRQFADDLIALADENPLTETIETVLFHQSLPVDVRHNVKIAREKLSVWAAQQLRAKS